MDLLEQSPANQTPMRRAASYFRQNYEKAAYYLLLLWCLLPVFMSGNYVISGMLGKYPSEADLISEGLRPGYVNYDLALQTYQRMFFILGGLTFVFALLCLILFRRRVFSRRSVLRIPWFYLLALFLILRKNPWFDEHFDGIVYAVYVGLGFAAFENVAYVLSAGDQWMTVAAMRALLAVPGHYGFAILMGYYYSMYHFVKPSFANGLKVFLAPVLAHGVYDSLAMSGAVDPVAGGISFFVLIYFCIKFQKLAHKKVVALASSEK
jgi:RsiW-degrading membrane proteinase PrsW (M82 family)